MQTTGQTTGQSVPEGLSFDSLFEPIIEIPNDSDFYLDEYEAVEVLRDDDVITAHYMVVSVS